MSAFTTRRVLLYAGVALALAVLPLVSLAQERTVEFTGGPFGECAGCCTCTAVLQATVTSTDGAVAGIPVTFVLRNLWGLSRSYGPVLTNALGVATAHAYVPADVYTLSITAQWGQDPPVAAPDVVYFVPPCKEPLFQSYVLVGGQMEDCWWRGQRNPCDEEDDRPITFGLMLMRNCNYTRQVRSPQSFASRFIWIDPNGPIYPTCQLDPVCGPVRIESRLIERWECPCQRSLPGILQDLEEGCVRVYGKASVNGEPGYPFVLTLSRNVSENPGCYYTAEIVVTNKADVNFQPLYKGKFKARCPCPRGGCARTIFAEVRCCVSTAP